MQDQLITKYADAVDNLLGAIPQRVRWTVDPTTGREAPDMSAMTAAHDAMKNTGRCYLCNNDSASEMQDCMPGDGLRMCLPELRDACIERRNALHSSEVPA